MLEDLKVKHTSNRLFCITCNTVRAGNCRNQQTGGGEDGRVPCDPCDASARGVCRADFLASLGGRKFLDDIRDVSLVPGGVGLQAGGEGVSWPEGCKDG